MSTINKIASAIQVTLPVAGKRVEVRGTSMRSLLKAIDNAFKAEGLTARDAVPMKNRARQLLRKEGLVFKGTDTAKQRASRAQARSIVIGRTVKDLGRTENIESWNSVAATLRERANLKIGTAAEVERVAGVSTERVEEYLAADVYKAVPKYTSPKREKLKGSRRSNRFAAPSKPAKSGEALEMSVEKALKTFVRAAAKARKAARKAAEARAEREAEREARLERAKATDEALTARAAAKKEAKATRKQARIAFLKASVEELDAELDAKLEEFNELFESGDSPDDQAKLAWLDQELARLEAAIEPLETELEKLEPGASC